MPASMCPGRDRGGLWRGRSLVEGVAASVITRGGTCAVKQQRVRAHRACECDRQCSRVQQTRENAVARREIARALAGAASGSARCRALAGGRAAVEASARGAGVEEFVGERQSWRSWRARAGRASMRVGRTAEGRRSATCPESKETIGGTGLASRHSALRRHRRATCQHASMGADYPVAEGADAD